MAAAVISRTVVMKAGASAAGPNKSNKGARVVGSPPSPSPTKSSQRLAPLKAATATRPVPLPRPAGLEQAQRPVKSASEPIRLRIGDDWYDCRGWAAAHPGGARWIEWFDGRDATAVFYSLHSYGPNGSSLAADRLAKLPRCDPPPSDEPEVLPTAREYAQMKSFEELRAKLVEDGFFKRDVLKEAWALAQVLGLYAVGTAQAYDHPVLATLILGLGMQQAGWLAHDYIHGRGWWCDMMRPLGSLFNGHSAEWWTQKHSLHHCFTNEEEFDHDIFMEPFFFLRPPAESGRPDSPLRKYQHIYGYPLISTMYWLWRVLSLKTVIKNKDAKEAGLLAIHYAWLLFCLPLPVAIGSIFVGGFMVGGLVSATHQSEEIMLEGDAPDFVEGQFRSTRDADTVFGPFETWLWGGMDTQLEHHLFPTMPRYNYHELRPILQAWAKENGAGYRISPSTKIISDNFDLLKKVADA